MPESGIFKTEPFYKKALFWQIVAPLSLFLLGLLMFREELGIVWGFFSRSGDEVPGWQEIGPALAVMFFNFLAFVFFSLITLLLVSQFVLPVRTLGERIEVFKRLLLYLSGGHGPAIKVREAQLVASKEELASSRPGVAFVDLCSAIALERRWLPVGGVGERSRSARSARSILRAPRRLLRAPRRLLRTRKPQKRGALVRVAGPGIVFTEWGEKIRGVADLRRQFRLTPNINAADRHGFEIRTHVWVLFGLGEPAEVIRVAYTGEKPEDLRAVTFTERQENGQKRQYIKLTDELDDEDKAEIHQSMASYRPPDDGAWQEDSLPQRIKPPYLFDPDRVFAAIYAQAQTKEENKQELWADLPGKVAIATFRDLLARRNLDDLLKPKVPFDKADADTFPLLNFRKELSRTVRNLGVLSFQFMYRKDGQMPVDGAEWIEEDWEIFPVQPLRTPKVLRERGIRVIAAGFPEIIPTQEGVRESWTEYWSAQWQQREQHTNAVHALAAARLRSSVRVKTQRGMYLHLKKVMEDPDLSREALVLQVLQTLEGAVSNPSTRRLMPNEAVNLLYDLRGLLTSGTEEL